MKKLDLHFIAVIASFILGLILFIIYCFFRGSDFLMWACIIPFGITIILVVTDGIKGIVQRLNEKILI